MVIFNMDQDDTELSKTSTMACDLTYKLMALRLLLTVFITHLKNLVLYHADRQ